jgi:iron complex outermembrane receptor protein
MIGHALSFHVTRFDQTASGLIQLVSTPGDAPPGGPRIAYELQNVGAITNRGWELEGALRSGRLTLTGTLAFVDSRIQSLAPGYSGDLQVGDRMLEVPARTMSLQTSWTDSRWSTSVTLYRAADWINYDRLALARAFATENLPSSAFVGPVLREYWIAYPGATHLRASATASVAPGWGLTLTGDNLLDIQTGEPDNITVLPGRTISLGLHTVF